MLMKMYSLWDSQAQMFSAPFCAPRQEIAVRAVREVLQGESNPAKYPDEFSLFEVGEFDDATGDIEGVAPKNLGPLSQWRSQ